MCNCHSYDASTLQNKFGYFTVALLPNVLLINKNHTLSLILVRKFLLLLIALLYVVVEATANGFYVEVWVQSGRSPSLFFPIFC